MCENLISIKSKQRTGYKVVAVDNKGDYFSLAMGFKYTDKLIPIINVQKAIGGFFNSFILKYMYRKNMVGRTAIFTKKQDAKRLAGNPRLTYDGFNVSIKKAIVSIDLMKGNYEGMSVIAGRKIRFLD